MTAPVQIVEAIAEALYHHRFDRAACETPPFETYSQDGRAELHAQAFVALGALIESRPHHFVTFTPEKWTLEHSMECRLSGEMVGHCRFEAAVQNIAADFEEGLIGRWRLDNIDKDLPLLVEAPA